MKKLIYLIFTIFLFNSVFADEPLLSNESEVYNCSISLSDGTKYSVISDYQNLIPIKFKNKDILFSIYKNEELYDNVNLEKVISNYKKLEKTVSHYYWGTINFVSTEGILLNTVEGKKIYNLKTKQIIPVKINNNFYIVKDELKSLTDKKCYEYLSELFDYIFTYNDNECIGIIEKWKKYGVQISSEIVDNKEVIFFDFFYGANKNWLSSNIGLQEMDGGNNFWRIYYDVKEHKFFNLRINGYA